MGVGVNISIDYVIFSNAVDIGKYSQSKRLYDYLLFLVHRRYIITEAKIAARIRSIDAITTAIRTTGGFSSSLKTSL